jgi:membrane-bound lytic murein transglycosylase A
VERGKKLPVPDARPSEQIAKLFPQAAPAKDNTATNQKTASSAPAVTVGEATAAVPLPLERPKEAPPAEIHHNRDHKRLRHP